GPWIWIPMLIACAHGVRRGRADSRSWFVLCTASVPIVLFTLVALWVPTGGHYHWQATGYLMLFLLLGNIVAQKLENSDIQAKRWLFASTAAIFLIVGVIAAEAGTGWAHLLLQHSFRPEHDPTLKGLEWNELRTAAAARGWLEQPRLFVV